MSMLIVPDRPVASTAALPWLFPTNSLSRYVDELQASCWQASRAVARAPFDAMRAHYANAVRAGLIEKSMLASRDFQKAVAQLERIALGPLAERV
jgi:hypothetical protein